MKKLILILLLVTGFSLSMSAKEEVLTNQGVVDLVSMGFNDTVIISKINTSEIKFDLSITEMKSLLDRGVSQNVISAMLAANEKAGQLAEAQKAAEAEEAIQTEAQKEGIYYLRNNKENPILASVFSGQHTAGKLKSKLTFKWANKEVRSELPNSTSRNIINESEPSFVFYFSNKAVSTTDENTKQQIVSSNWWFRMASSPNEFVMLKLDKSGNRRELVTSTENRLRTRKGIDTSKAIQFSIQVVNDRKFIVKPVKPLDNGEYCFFYQGTVPEGGSNQAVFDFSVKAD